MNDPERDVGATLSKADLEQLTKESKEALIALDKSGEYVAHYGLNPANPTELLVEITNGLETQRITIERNQWRRPGVVTGALIDQLNI